MGFTEKTRPAPEPAAGHEPAAAPEPAVGHERTPAEWVGPAALAVLLLLTGAFAKRSVTCVCQ
ncbi:hypothetical protein HRW23_09855 [Streptomyces lunaelactis]|uniref:hypothetical protein n=1 Tax=Streptomyces lunaelactis TaxID=1535768 RepID=UPI00158529D0|nr:hypothetical protein [Streptomyces lunaelactis]